MYTLFYPEIINAKLFNRTEAVSLAWPWGLGFPDLIKFRYVFGLQTLRLNVIAAHVLTGKIPQVKQLLSFVKRKQGFLFVIDLDVSGNAKRHSRRQLNVVTFTVKCHLLVVAFKKGTPLPIHVEAARVLLLISVFALTCISLGNLINLSLPRPWFRMARKDNSKNLTKTRKRRHLESEDTIPRLFQCLCG